MHLLCALSTASLLASSPTVLQQLGRPLGPGDLGPGRLGPGAVTWADVDGDGRPDLHLSGGAAPDRLYRNAEGGALVDATAEVGLAGTRSRSAAWADVDLDGDPDLYLASEHGSRFFLNHDGVLEDATELVGLDHDGLDLAATWSDYDGDGRPDLHVVRPGSLRLYRNEGGSFAALDVAAAGLPTAAGAWVAPEVGGASDAGVSPDRAPEGPRSGAGRPGVPGGPSAPSAGSAAGATVTPTGVDVAASALFCATGVTDEVTGKCVGVSSTPAFEKLLPVGTRLQTMSSTTGTGMYFEYNPTDRRLELYGANTSQILGPHLSVNRSDGRVGIGTAAPDADLHVSGGDGPATLRLSADDDNAGETDQPRLVLTQDGGGVEGVLGYLDGTNDLTLSNDFGDSALHLMDNGEVQLRNLAGVKSMELDADEDGAGAIRLFDGVGGEGVALEADDGLGGRLVLRPVGSNATVVIDSREQGDDGAQLVLGTDYGINTIVLDAEFNDGGSARVDLRNSSGVDTISLDGATGRTTTRTLSITGGSDIAEPFDVAGHVEPGMVVAIDPRSPGALRLASEPYDTTVVGVVSGAGGIRPGLTLTQEETLLDGRHPVALSGRVYVRVDASEAPVRPGDFLTTSSRPGFAMKAADPQRRQGAVLGKAMSALEEGTGLVLLLVNLQ